MPGRDERLNMKYLVSALYFCIGLVFAANACKTCNGKGYYETYKECPLCEGYGTVSPSWFDMSTGETRWTETTYWTGVKDVSNVRHKSFSFKPCPFCAKSAKAGGIKTLVECDCGAEIKVPKELIKTAKAKLLSKAKSLKLPIEKITKILDDSEELYLLNVVNWSRCWTATGKRIKIFSWKQSKAILITKAFITRGRQQNTPRKNLSRKLEFKR